MECDVVIVGAGNAALCAALSAHESGARVVVLECAPEAERGGNTRFTGGAIRFVYSGVDDIRKLVPDLSDEQVANTDFGTYTEEQFFDTMAEVTQCRTNPDLCEVLVKSSNETVHWMHKQGVKFQANYGRQAFKVDGRFKFFGGSTLTVWGGGPGLIEALNEAVRRAGIKVLYRAAAKQLIHDDTGVHGVVAKIEGKTVAIKAKSVVLACGGFEANAEWRTRYLGFGWDLAKVRGTRYNTGDGIRMALDIGAQPYGNWSCAHACEWDLNAPEFGDLAVGDGFSKHSYPFSVMLNSNGVRFLDEGADIRNFTYAKYGRVILEQPGQSAWQLYDSQVLHLLRDSYRIKQVTKVTANTLEELVTKLDGVNPEQALKTIKQYNAAVREDVPFNPNVKDGRGTAGLAIPKSNWAHTISKPPFEAYGVTCGITFTFGGLKITTRGQVVDTEERAIPGLYAAGELVGGVFYFNYPGSSGLTNGAVFGRVAGKSAGEHARR